MICFCRHPASFKLWISKVQDFGNFELSPMTMDYPNVIVSNQNEESTSIQRDNDTYCLSVKSCYSGYTSGTPITHLWLPLWVSTHWSFFHLIAYRVSSADNICKQFRPRSGLTFSGLIWNQSFWHSDCIPERQGTFCLVNGLMSLSTAMVMRWSVIS